MIDAFIANDEIALLRYRLRLHKNVTTRVIIAEGNATLSGLPKALNIRHALTPAELDEYNIRLVTVPFAPPRVVKGNRSAGDFLPGDPIAIGLTRTPQNLLMALKREARLEVDALGVRTSGVNAAMRFTLNLAILEELNSLSPTALARASVYASDIDEILDTSPRAALTLSRLVEPDASAGTGCFAPKLRYLFYSPHCALHAERHAGRMRRIEWRRSILFNASTLRARLTSRHGHGAFFSPRYHILTPFGEHRIRGQLCGQTSFYAGWHLSYFMDSQKMISKFRASKVRAVHHALCTQCGSAKTP